MSRSSRFPAIVAYLVPILGWVYVLTFHRKEELAMYHLRQAVGLVLFLIGTLVGWAIIGWLLAWIPYLAVLSIALFALVIAAYIYGFIAWIMGFSNVMNYRLAPLPLFGKWASGLPIG